MTNLQPRPREELGEFEEFFHTIETMAGYIPNAYLILGHQPGFLRAMIGVSTALRAMHGVDAELKVLMSHLSSSAVGCRFCEAHTAKTANTVGVSDDKLLAVWEFESSPLFSDGERAALRLALDMATELETPVHEFASALLSDRGWDGSRHRHDEALG